jgi:hypothetical protein
MKRSTTFAMAAGAVLVLAALSAWLADAADPSLKENLRVVVPRSLELTFVLMVVGFAINFRGIRESLIDRRFLPVVVFLVALVAVSILPPRTHRIYYDEDIYENVAQNILWENRAQMCNEGIVEAGVFNCDAWEYNKEPNGFPFLLSTVFRVSGVDESAAHRLNHWLFALGAVAVYWIAVLLFEKTNVALGAALVFGLTPQNLLWGATVAVEPSAAAFGALAVGAWIYFCKNPSWSAGLFGACVLAFASQFRPESGLVLVAAAMAMVLLAPELLRRRQSWGAAVLLLLLLVPHLAHLWAMRHEKWGSSEAKFSMEHVPRNLRTNASYYVEGTDFPAAFSMAALLGLVYPRRKRAVTAMLLWFVLMFGIFIPFYAGSYRYGADVRFAGLSAAPLAVLAGAGMALVSEWMARRFDRSKWLSLVPYAVIVYAFSHYLPLVRAVGVEGWQARADHDVALTIVSQLPPNSILLTHNPGMIQVMGQSAAQSSLVSYQPARADRFFDRFPGGVYFHYNFWCNVDDEVQKKFCADVLERYQTQVLMEESAGFYRFVLHRLLPRAEPPPLPGTDNR